MRNNIQNDIKAEKSIEFVSKLDLVVVFLLLSLWVGSTLSFVSVSCLILRPFVAKNS